MASVVVVGGGIAGLSAAWRLQQLGHKVEVIEIEAAAGGRMRSEPRGDFVVDRGAQFIASGYRNLHALAAELGLSSQVRSVGRANNAILRDGVLHPGDYDNLLAFVRSRLVSTGTKLRLPRLLWEVARYRSLLDPRRPERALALDDESMPTYLRRIIGSEGLDFLVGPALSSTFDCEPEDLSAAFVLLTLRFVLSGFRLQSFEGGTGVLTRALANRLQVTTESRVSRLVASAQGVEVEFERGGSLQRRSADGAVVALPGSLVGSVCTSLSADEHEFFASVRYGRGIIVFLMLERAPATLPYYGVAFPRSEGLDLYGLAVDHHKAGVAPAGAGLLNAALRADAAQRVWDWNDARIVDLVVENLARTPIGKLTPIDAVVHRWDPMLPQFYSGYLRHLDRFWRRSKPSPRVAFAGDYLVGPYTEAALTSGLRAAASLRLE